ncbi:MAG TPA: poly-beta-1,6-N-acetyl-D-glucosamine N-deacetylase PgaB [Thermodesulfobacteriota bacterium]|nr:poly-beta-1,6-N-acetyl-D-glucosamine N-deacetylase PgaB [Thermodesulfobacteriota bacterium]
MRSSFNRVLGAVFLFFLLASGAPVLSAEGYVSDRAQFAYAKRLFDNKDYALSAREFSRVTERFPFTEFKERAHYLTALSLLRDKRYKEAKDGFEIFIRNFGESVYREEALKGALIAEKKLKEEGERIPVLRVVKLKPAPAMSAAMRAAQVLVFEGTTPEEIKKEISRMSSLGVNAIILRVFHNSFDRGFFTKERTAEGGVYFRSSRAPVKADVLSLAAAEARRNGIKIFAWMTTRYADYGVEERNELACRGYDIEKGVFTRCRGLDLFNDETVERLEGLYSDLASYDIDGILFQDDLILKHNEGFGPFAEALYRRDTGGRLDAKGLYATRGDGRVAYTAEFWKWASWKNKRLLYVAGRLKKAVRAKNPDVEFAINMMYESVTNPRSALAWFSQDFRETVKSGFDYYSIMAYHKQMSDELGKDNEEISRLIEDLASEAVEIAGEPRKVLIKFQTVDWTTGEPIDYGEGTELARRIEAKGVSMAVMPYMADFPFGAFCGTNGLVSLER